MRFRLTYHFKYRLLERGILMSHVKDALASPDFRSSVHEGKTLARKRIDGRTIEVIYFRKGDREVNAEYVIVTAYYL